MFKLLFRYAVSREAGLVPSLLAGTALEAGGIALGTAGPFLLKALVDALSTQSISAVSSVALVAAFVFAWTGATVLSAWRTVYSTRVICRLNEYLSLQAIEGSLPATTAAKDGDSGRVLGLLERVPYSLQIVCDGLIWRAGPLAIQIVIGLALIGGLIPGRYVLVLACQFLAFVAASWAGIGWHQRISRTANAMTSAVSQALGDVLRNSRRVVLNGALDFELRRLASGFGDKLAADRSVAWSLVQLSLLQYGVVGIGLFILLAMGAVDVAAHRMTVGEFVLLQAYAFRLALPLSGFGFVLSQAGVSIANIRDVVDLFPTLGGEVVSATQPLGATDISVKQVDFHYDCTASGLSGVTVDFPAGSFNVIVGPNGSGKSTLAQLIAGILEPTAGSIRYNGRDAAEIPRSQRHRFVLYVPQFIGLFNRSLGDNGLYPPTSHSVEELGQLLFEWRFYDGSRPVDFAAEVGEQGERLSGGQIQKLELARLAGVSVPAVILDESTSSLDPQSEWTIMTSLRRRFGTKTTLILITHRPRLAEAADQVLYIAAGRLVAIGGHSDLLEQVPDYRALWAEEPER